MFKVGGKVAEITREIDKIKAEVANNQFARAGKLQELLDQRAKLQQAGPKSSPNSEKLLSLINEKARSYLLRTQLRDIFDAFDMDGNGTLSAMELGRGLQSLLKTKLSRGELGALMASINKSETDQISYYPEFVAAVCSPRAGSAFRAAASGGAAAALIQGRRRSADQLLDALSDKAKRFLMRTHLHDLFETFDMDGDGTLTVVELARGLSALLQTTLSKVELAALMAHFRSDPDNMDSISFAEFLSALAPISRQGEPKARL